MDDKPYELTRSEVTVIMQANWFAGYFNRQLQRESNKRKDK